MRATQTVVAREAIIARWAGNKKTVRATRADNEITNKRRTNDEQKTVRAARADKEKTKKRRCESHGQMNK